MPSQTFHRNRSCYCWFLRIIALRTRIGRTHTDKLCSLLQIPKVWNANAFQNHKFDSILIFNAYLDPVQVSPVHPAACFRFDYSVLYSHLCDRLGDERTTLLLYMLLYQHQQFRNFVYTHTDIQRMVLAILRELYGGDDPGSHHLYMSLIILLLLSEDEGFNSNIHNVVIRNLMPYSNVFYFFNL